MKLIVQNYEDNFSLFCKVKNNLLSDLGDKVVVEHIGSTAVPNMSGKNIIDILIGVGDLSDIESVALKLDKMGFYRGKNNNTSEYIFFASKQEETGSGDIHLHLVEKGSVRFNNFVNLREYLLDHPDVAKDYSDAKCRLAKEVRCQREEYKRLKSRYVEDLLLMLKDKRG